MSLAPVQHTAPFARLDGDARDRPLLILIWVVTAAALTLSFGFAPILDRLSTDDAMRLVEVRDLLAGQGWFDLVQHRLAPPEGVGMHWSRLIDLPLAMLVRAGATVLTPPDAERVALVAWPILLLLPTFAGVAQLARRLADGRAGALALLIAPTVGTALVHFRPGAIDHHNAQIVLLIWALALLARQRPSPSATAAAAFLSALSLAIGLETLPAIIAISAAVALRWVVEGPQAARETASFGATLAAALVALFAATVPHGQFQVPTCDALSIVQITAGGLGGAGLAALALSVRGGAWPLRLAAAAGLGLVAATIVGGLYPQCLADPIGTDPRLAALWLDNNAEVRSVLTVARDLPQDVLPIFGFAVAGLALGLVVLRRDREAAPWPWLLAIATLVTLIAISLWLVRAAAMADLVAVPLIAASLVRLFPAGERRFLGLTRPALVGALMLNQAAFVLVGEASARGLEAMTHARAIPFAEGAASCRRPADFTPLAALPPSLVLAFIDSGPYILTATGHSVLAAPYHRNVRGNGAMFDTFLSPPAAAMRRLAGLDVDYIAFCPGAPERFIYAATAPDGLAAALGRGEVPDFLTPVELSGTPVSLYRVRR